MTQGDGGGDNSVDCKKYPQHCNGNDPKTGDELRDLRNKKKCDTLDIYDLTDKGYFQSWDGEKNIPPDYWQYLLSDIRDDVHSTWVMFLPIEATWYDTPFYNDDTPFKEPLSGRGCLDDKCYDRSKLNYVAQGELWAAVGVTNKKGHEIVKFWKEAKCLWMCERNNLQEENEMFDIGYSHYQELYPPQPKDTIIGIFPLPNEGPGT